jgi:hypothetical protein
MVGIEQDLKVAEIPSVKQWLDNIRQHLPENPLLVPDFMIVSQLLPAEIKQQPHLQVASV